MTEQRKIESRRGSRKPVESLLSRRLLLFLLPLFLLGRLRLWAYVKCHQKRIRPGVSDQPSTGPDRRTVFSETSTG